jgi:DNA repair exonuclease SbcCD nuclease subunit
VFDRRKYVNYVTLSSCRGYFFEKFWENDIELTALVGNHDVYFKNTNEINSLDLLLKGAPRIRIITGPQEWIKDEILLVPWICPDNFVKTIEMIEKTKANICFGHLELAGFEMHKGSIPAAGIDSNVFQKFQIVATGHFHHKSSKRNIKYLGAPYEMTWADYDDERGFHIFDTKTREFEYIKNPYTIFNKIMYDDKKKTIEGVLEVDFNKYKDTYVKLVIVNKTNPYWFDMFIDKFEAAGVYDLQVIENSVNLGIEDSELITDAEDTLSILRKYVEQVDFNTDKKRLDLLFTKLYNDSLNLE